jgi:cobalt-zinc-cadmium efflux system outer membrane protein
MIEHSQGRSAVRVWGLLSLSGLVCASLLVGVAQADPPAAVEPLPSILSLEEALRWALQYHPDLAVVRQQHGIAAAAVVIARTYPFNPVWTNKLFAVNGPVSSGITNRLAMEQRISLDLEIHGQGKFRRQAACAALTRTDWEIALREDTVAVRVVRAFNGVLYARGRLQLAEETVRLDEHVVEQVRTLVERGGGRPEELIAARSELLNARAALGALRSALQHAEQELRLALGVTDAPSTVAGTLQEPPPAVAAEVFLEAALQRRPELRAREAAVQEASARLGLALADRYGNPNIGPDYEYNETRDNFIGAQLVLPLPVFNKHKGEILQRQAERERAILDLHSTEVAVRQVVLGALDRLREAQVWVDSYRTQVLPTQEAMLKDMETLLAQGRVDLSKVTDLRRRQLQARGSYLDALYEASQAQADLAAAVGDLTLALPPCQAAIAEAQD